MARIVDVARHAGVTPGMVSRVLNGDPTLRVRDETRERIRAAAEELGYAPNPAARALRRASTGALGLVMHDLANPIYAEILSGAQQAAVAADHALLLGDADELARGERTLHTVLGGRRIDGLLLQRAGLPSDRVLAELAAARLPTVLLNDWAAEEVSSVALDDLAAARLATRHVLDLGHTAIAHLAGALDSHRARQRRRGFEQALAERRLTARPAWTAEGGWDVASGRAAARRLLDARPRPTAIVAANVIAAIGAVGAIKEAGLALPADVSLVAIHDVWFAEHMDPPLTTVALPLAEMGRVAVGVLLDEINGQPAQRILIKEPAPVLTVRGSTGAPRR